MIEFMGYRIEREKSYYRVTSLADSNVTWTEDSIMDAKRSIKRLWEEQK